MPIEIGVEVISNNPITVTTTGTVVATDIGVFSRSLDGGDMSSISPPAFILTNTATGVIQGGIDGVQILADPTHAATGTFIVDNAGTIESTGTGQPPGTIGQAIDFSDLTSPTHTIITNQSTGLIQAANGDAIEPGANATINNYGQIVSLSSGDGINFQSNSGGVVNNFAGATIHGANAGITALAAITVYNEGTIQGDGGQAISITDTSTDTITNKGTIIGGISTGGGDDVLNLYTGSSISGLSDGGAGIDTINLFGTGTGTLSNVVNFEDIVVQAGSWTILGTESFAAGVTIQVGNGGTTGALTGGVTDNGVLAFDRSDAFAFSGLISGAGIVEQIGTGTTTLSGHNTYSGGTELFSGTLEVATTDGAGTGAITFEAGAQVLRIETTALSGGHFANTIDGFSQQSTIDLAGIGLATSATLGAGNVLTIAGGTVSPITLQLDSAQSFLGNAFRVTSDGAGGTDVTLLQVITINNSGTITSTTGDGVFVFASVPSAIIITNSGSITAADNGVIASATDLDDIASFSLTNTATGVIQGGLDAVKVTATTPNPAATGTFVVDNAGTIESTGAGQAIDFSALISPLDQVTITNKGELIGGILSGAGDDVLNLYTGSSISGLSDGGAGSDTINLFGAGTGTLSNLANFENLDDQAGSWTILDSESFTGAVTIAAGAVLTIAAGAVLQVGNGGTTGVLSGDVVDNGVLALDRSDAVTFGGVISGSGVFQQIGTGTTTLNGHNTYSGGTELFSGTLEVATTDGAGTGAITFEAGAQVLRIETAALSGGHFANTIDGFSQQSAIDLAGIGLATSATLGAGNVLTISGGTVGPITLQLDPGQSFANNAFRVTSDGAGGTDVTLLQVITINNIGTITSTGDGVLVFASVPSAIIVTNSGSITAADNGVIASATDLDDIASFSLTNTATGVIQGGLDAVKVTATTLNPAATGTFVVDNAGTIQSTGTGQAIDFSDLISPLDQVTITNHGTLIGGILSGAGDDVLNLYTSSSISGLSDGGAGIDTINLLGTGTGTLSNIANFEHLNDQSGSWTILDSESFSAGIAIFAGAVLEVGNGGAAGALTGDVADNGVLAFDRSDALTFGGVISGSGIVEQIGTGTTTLNGHNGYSGGTEIFSGTLDVATIDGAGTGAITFETGAQALRIEASALSGGHFVNTIDGFSNQDTVDLAGVGLATSVTLGANNVLTISGGTITPITLQLDPGQSFAGEVFSVASDGAGGTNVTLAQVISGSGGGTITGTPGNDIINAGNGSSTIIAGQGNDTISAGNGTDSVIAGNGNNTISVDSGSDTVTAGNGNNVITGGHGTDIITVGNGNNTINAANGADVLKVGSGNNTLTGGNGGDSFVFGPDFGKNVITDFSHVDHIEFDGGVFADFHAVQAASHQVGTDTVISLDADHSVTLVGVALTSLHASDFILH